MISWAALALALSASQVQALNLAYTIGNEHGLGYTLSAISWEESSFCRFKVNHWSRGCTGIKRSTARLFDPQVTREQLTDDDERNLRDGLAYLLYCRDNTAGWSEMVYCYHYGLPAELAAQTEYEIVSDAYVKSLKAKLKKLRSIKISTDP